MDIGRTEITIRISVLHMSIELCDKHNFYERTGVAVLIIEV